MADRALARSIAPSLAEIESLALASFARLPKHFRTLSGEVVIRVSEFPSEDVQAEMKAGPFDLLGLFQGVGLAQDGTPRYKQTARTRSDSTINRYLDCLRSILGVAYEARDWTGKRVLEDLPDLPDLREPIHLPRPIPDADLMRIMEAAPPHLTAGIFVELLHRDAIRAENLHADLGDLLRDLGDRSEVDGFTLEGGAGVAEVVHGRTGTVGRTTKWRR